MTGILEELGEAECLELLARYSVGRLAVTLPNGCPLIVPVNYVFVDDHIVFRTGEGTKLSLIGQRPVSFEIDQIDPFAHTGWSVLVQGVAEEVEPGTVRPDPEPWVGGERGHWIRIVPMSVSGRHIALPTLVFDGRGYV